MRGWIVQFILGVLLLALLGSGIFVGVNHVSGKYEQLVLASQNQAAHAQKQAAKYHEANPENSKPISDLRAIVSKLTEQIWSPDLVGTSVPVSMHYGKPGPFAPVSMTRLSGHQFLVVNYREVFLFDEDKKEAKQVTLKGGVPVWNPTAIFYSAFYDRVFIANYTGADVIVAKVVRDGDDVSLVLVERILHEEGIKGPEGIAISRGGRFMALADYVGNQVSLFERVNGAWAFRWKQPLVAAHGIAIVSDNVYAGGIAIAKFNIESGQEVARSTAIGSQPILFATCLSEDRNTGDIVGSDTMAGRVFLMTPDLKIKASFGANGPTFANLSMPYCAYRDGKATYVLSTYQDRIIKIEDEKTTSFELSGPKWKYLPPVLNSAGMWHGAAKFDNPTFSIFGTSVSPSYGSVLAAAGTTLLMPGRRALGDNDWPFYVTTMAKAGDWVVMAANSSSFALLYDTNSGDLSSVGLDDWDCWVMAERVLCPSGDRRIDDLTAKRIEISTQPSPSDAAKFLEASKGKTIPMLDYWRAWKAATN